MGDRFVSEPIEMDMSAPPAVKPVAGDPVMTTRFRWSGTDYEIKEIVEMWKEAGADIGGSGEQYYRKHWFHIKCQDGTEMKIYFDRQPLPSKKRMARWWLFTIVE